MSESGPAPAAGHRGALALRAHPRTRPRRRDVRRLRVGRRRDPRAGHRDPPERHRPGRSTEGWLETRRRRPARRRGSSSTPTPSRCGSGCRPPPSRAHGPCTCGSPASSTTSCTASTGRRFNGRRRQPSTRSPPRSSRPPTPGGPSRAGTSRRCKAVFSVTLVVPESHLAVSNAAELSSEPTGDGLRTVVFADTMHMSTYLVAFVVGPLEATEPVDVDGTPLRVVHPPGSGHLTAFALEAGAFCAATPGRLLRHPLSRRQARPRRHPRLLVRGHGEPRLRHVPRDAAADRPGHGSRRPSSNGSPTWSPTSWPTCGSATW